MSPGSPRNALSLQYDNRARVPEHPAIFDRWATDSRRTRERHRGLIDLPYGPSSAERLDVFPAAGGRAPALVFFHGGYWRAFGKGDFSFIADAWLRAGVTVVVVGYGLCPAVSVQDIVRQALRAGAWIYRNAGDLGIDRNQLCVSGHSAGGHLAAMLMAALWPSYSEGLPTRVFGSAVSLSGLHDLRPLAQVDFLQADLKLTEESALSLSPAYMPAATDRPMLACVGGDESEEYHRQMVLLQQRWPSAAGQRVELPGVNHFTILDALVDPTSALFKTVRRVMGI